MQILLAILAFGLMILVHELGHFGAAKLFGVKVNDFSIGMGPRIWGFQKGETTYTLRALPIGGSCAMEGEDEDTRHERAFGAKPVWQRFIILASGALMNLVLGIILLIIVLAPAKSLVVPTIDRLADEITDEGLFGLQAGDTILKINGENVYVVYDVQTLLARYEGSTYDILIKRDGKKLLLEKVPLVKRELTIDGKKALRYGLVYKSEKVNPLNITGYAFLTAADYVRLIRMSLVDLVSGKVSAKELSGPVGITAQLSSVTKEAGFLMFLQFVAFITINLAVMNLLPLPALDGGRIVFLVVELVLRVFRKKPLNQKYEGYIHLAGLALFMLLMVYTTFNDIARLVS